LGTLCSQADCSGRRHMMRIASQTRCICTHSSLGSATLVIVTLRPSSVFSHQSRINQGVFELPQRKSTMPCSSMCAHEWNISTGPSRLMPCSQVCRIEAMFGTWQSLSRSHSMQQQNCFARGESSSGLDMKASGPIGTIRRSKMNDH